ncbi:helix-turn-helix domain-containing protein [Streptomyces sp. Da 82-17]|uniref:helix-turn-helix domain-containing protein n=1 Tax=Streptomyces sp. Da 82-17 TaxID=3377116 RepID=UPI0038D3D62B
MAGRPRDAVVLTEDERATLLLWTRSRTCSQARALRARIVLACADEPTNTAVAERLGISRGMVGKWRGRFLADRLDGLDEQARPGRPPAADDDTTAHVLVRTLTPPPGPRETWSTRSMAAETGLSQSTVSRIWRTYGIRPGARDGAAPRRTWSLPGRAEEVVGLFVAPPLCVLAVTIKNGTSGGDGSTPATAVTRLFGPDRDVPHVLAVAGAFAELRGGQHPQELSEADRRALHTFVDQARARASSSAVVHLLAHGVPTEAPGSAYEAAERSDATGTPRIRWHCTPSLAAWTGEALRILSPEVQPPNEAAHELPRLRDELLTWSTTWTRSAAPFTRISAPRPPYDAPVICMPDSDSNVWESRTHEVPTAPMVPQVTATDATPGAPVTTDPVVGALREALLDGHHVPGERVRETPLATRLGVPRRVVRTGLRALADEGMLDLLPSGATAMPTVTPKDVLDLYALRASLGALLIRRVAMLGIGQLAPASKALAEVRGAADNGDHIRIREVDLRYQDALARIADLPQAAHTFERLTARLRMFVTLLDMDYSHACDTIANEDGAIHDALRNADGNEAARLWRVKIERCVRFMIAQLPEDDVAPHLWATLAGRPHLHREAVRGAPH